jgi:hypothetical protein
METTRFDYEKQLVAALTAIPLVYHSTVASGSPASESHNPIPAYQTIVRGLILHINAQN